jgi:hypothetical protein
MSGNLTLKGTPEPLTIPAGAQAGYVWTCTDSEGDGEWAPAGGSTIDGVTVSGTPSTGQSITATSPTTANWQTPAAGVTLDSTASDIQPLGSRAAGSVGKAADAGHVHPAAAVSSGGTGQTSLTAYELLAAGTTSTGAIQQVGLGTSGQVLTSNGSGALPTFQAAPSGGGGLGSVTLTGTPVEGQAIVATSSTAATWQGLFGTRPEMFGTINGTSDGAIINAAISAINSGSAPGPLVLTQGYNIEETITLLPGVNIWGSGQGNRQVFQDSFSGAYIRPNSSFPTNTPLITIGATGDATTNPCGATLFGVNLSGLTAGSVNTSNCAGVLITDTADVHMINCFLADFDRPGGTGTCVGLVSSTSGNGVGFIADCCIFSASWQGINGEGAGVTDLRIANCLFHSCTENLTLGTGASGGGGLTGSGGGGGLQLTNSHFTYTGMPSTGWHLSLGSQAGDFTISNNYFDQAGSAIPVQLATAKGILSNNHFLAASTSSANSLVKLSTSTSQELTFMGNDLNTNGSGVFSFLQTTAHSGTPTGGVYLGNVVYTGTGGDADLLGVLIDSSASPIGAANSATTYIQGNVICT